MEEIQNIKEGIADLKATNSFSFEEIRIGTWVDGKPLYRKMIDFGVLTTGSKSIPVDIPDILHGHVNIGASMFTNNLNNNLSGNYNMYSMIVSDMIAHVSYSSGEKIIIESPKSNASSYKAYICLEYTKVID